MTAPPPPPPSAAAASVLPIDPALRSFFDWDSDEDSGSKEQRASGKTRDKVFPGTPSPSGIAAAAGSTKSSSVAGVGKLRKAFSNISLRSKTSPTMGSSGSLLSPSSGEVSARQADRPAGEKLLRFKTSASNLFAAAPSTVFLRPGMGSSMPTISPSLTQAEYDHQQELPRDASSQTLTPTTSTTSSATLTSPTRSNTNRKLTSPSPSVPSPLARLPSGDVADTDPELWQDSVRVVRQRVQQEAKEEQQRARQAHKAEKRMAKEASKRPASSAQKLTAALIETFRQHTACQLKRIEDMTEEDFEFVSNNVNAGKMDMVKDFLRQSIPSQGSPTPRPAGQVRQPAQAETSGSQEVVGLGIESAPRKITMTPELQQELGFAKVVREEELKTMPVHPSLRSNHNNPPRTEATLSSTSNSRRPHRASEASESTAHSINIDIDDVLRDWEQSSTPTVPVADLTSEIQALRQEFGLTALRGRRASTTRHPRHGFEFYSKRLMCRGIHNPAEALKRRTTSDRTGGVQLTDHQKQLLKERSTAYQAPRKCAGEGCEEYCCHYGKLISKSVTTKDDSAALTEAERCREEANKLKSRKPNGVDAWESFLQCVFCGKEYCPTCIMVCENDLCHQTFCIYCRAGSVCGDHE